jgi:ribosome-associated protein
LLDTVKFVARIADEKKADYIKILNVGLRLVITDYFIIIGVKNIRLTKRIEEEIGMNLKKRGITPLSVNGISDGNWILMDYDDFVVHIFTDEYRSYYDLERLWRDSKVVKFETDIQVLSPDKKA